MHRSAQLLTGSIVFVLAPVANAQFVSGSITWQSVSVSANTNYDVVGLPADAAGAGDSYSSLAPLPQMLSASAALTMPTNGTGNSFDADLSIQSEVFDDRVTGSSQYLFNYVKASSGFMNASTQLVAVFNVTGSVAYEANAAFFSTGAGHVARLTNEVTGDLVDGAFFGDPLAATGTLSAGTYRFNVLLNRGASGAGGSAENLERAVQYELIFSNVPSPATGLALLGLAGMRRRR